MNNVMSAFVFFLALRKKIVRRVRRLNPLNNQRAMLQLNPYSAVLKRQAILSAQKRQLQRDELLAKKRGITLSPENAVIRTAKLQARRRAQILKAKKEKPAAPKGGKKAAAKK